jgi:hypothetical protein
VSRASACDKDGSGSTNASSELSEFSTASGGSRVSSFDVASSSVSAEPKRECLNRSIGPPWSAMVGSIHKASPLDVVTRTITWSNSSGDGT